jgi:hypothetical protein
MLMEEGMGEVTGLYLAVSLAFMFHTVLFLESFVLATPLPYLAIPVLVYVAAMLCQYCTVVSALLNFLMLAYSLSKVYNLYTTE